MSKEVPAERQPLEERITYCEHLADTLNAVVTDLQKRMLALEHQNRELWRELRQQQENDRSLGTTGEKPPHY